MPLPMPVHEVPKAPAQSAPATRRLSPDEEAMQLMLRVVERVEVAKSFAKIAAGIVSVTAARASVQLRAAADAKMAEAVERDGGVLSQVERVRKIARAAKEAAVHVATHRPPRDDASDTSNVEAAQPVQAAQPTQAAQPAQAAQAAAAAQVQA